MPHLQERTFESSDGTVHYWITEELLPDAPWLVFLPGLTADHTLFEPQLEFFVDKANVFTWDAPAHGKSRPYALNFSLDDYARILHSIFVREDITHPVLIGQSLGGYLSQAYMELYPESVRGFISIDSAPLKRHYYAGWELGMMKHTQGMYAAIPWNLLLKWGSWGVATSEAGRANMLSMMEQYNHKEYAALAGHGFRMLCEAVEMDRSYKITCPVLLLCGDKDQAGSSKRYNRAWTKTEGFPLVWVHGAGHNSTVDAPAFINGSIERFLTSL